MVTSAQVTIVYVTRESIGRCPIQARCGGSKLCECVIDDLRRAAVYAAQREDIVGGGCEE